MTPKKICILGPAYPYRGGLATYDERLAVQFQNEGHEVDVVTFTLQYPGFLFPGKTQFSTSPAPEGLHITRQVNSVNPLNWWRVGRRLRRKHYDVVVMRFWIPLMGPCMGTIARIIRRGGTRVVCIVDNIIPHEHRPGDRLLTRYFTRSVDAFVTMSHEVYNDLDLFLKHPKRCYVPHPLFDTYGAMIPREEALRLLDLDPSQRYLLFFGFIRDYKGLDILLEAMNTPEVKATEARLIVAGEFYGNREAYLNQISRLGIADRVILRTDYIPDNEINRYFGAIDLIVQPYKSATQSGVTQMGYAFEKAMLVSNVGGLPELVEHGQSGYVVEPTPKAVAEAIADFYNNGRQSAFEARTRELKKRFDWKELTAEILKFLDL